MSENRTAPPDEMADIREDYALILICNLRVHVRRALASNDGKALVYQTPAIKRRLPANKIDRSAVGLNYKVLSEKPFD